MFNLSVKTIQTYREHIKRKLGLRNATEKAIRNWEKANKEKNKA